MGGVHCHIEGGVIRLGEDHAVPGHGPINLGACLPPPEVSPGELEMRESASRRNEKQRRQNLWRKRLTAVTNLGPILTGTLVFFNCFFFVFF